jgi:hypothetical protein
MGGLAVRGISYALEGLPPESVHADLRVIRDELRCTAVMLIGTDARELAEAARSALGLGLDVWIRPHLEDARPRQLREHLTSRTRGRGSCASTSSASRRPPRSSAVATRAGSRCWSAASSR